MIEPLPSDAAFEAIEAFRDGNLLPLAAYLKAGGNVFGQMAFMIAMAIEGDGPVRLTIHRTSKDRHPLSAVTAKYERDLTIGCAIEVRLRAEPGLKYKDGVSDAAAAFGVSKETARKALAGVRRQLAGDHEGFPFVDLVTLAQNFPGWRSLKSPGPKRRVQPK